MPHELYIFNLIIERESSDFNSNDRSSLVMVVYQQNSRTKTMHQFNTGSHQTADQPTINADQFLWLGRGWSGKKLPALIEERIYPRSTPAVSALYPWCTHAQIPLSPTYPRPSGWPIPALHDQLPTYSWHNYAHYAQHRTNPRSVCLISTLGLKWIIQANVKPTDSLMRVQYPKCACGLYCKLNPI